MELIPTRRLPGKLTDHGANETAKTLGDELDSLGALFERRLSSKMLKKLGIFKDELPGDSELLLHWLRYIETERLDYTLSFRNLANYVESDAALIFSKDQRVSGLLSVMAKEASKSGLETEKIKEEMNRVNPVFIPRNHRIEQVIEAGLKGDFNLFHEMNEVLKKPYEEHEEFSRYKLAPSPEEVVHATFCGT